MGRQKRDWTTLFQEQEQTGESIKEFCKGKGIHPIAFYKSRKNYRQKSIIEITAPAALEADPIVLRTGSYSVSIKRGFDPESLKSVLEVIGENE